MIPHFVIPVGGPPALGQEPLVGGGEPSPDMTIIALELEDIDSALGHPPP
jgi:hypothetical protein